MSLTFLNFFNFEDRPWTLIVQTAANGTTSVTERKLGGPSSNSHVPGDVLPPSITIISTTTIGNQRVVVVTRALKGLSKDYYTFNIEATNPTISFITASGNTPTLSYHKVKEPFSLTMLPINGQNQGACVCPQKPAPFGQALGSLIYNPVANQTYDTGTGSVAFGGYKTCKPYPVTVLLEQKNPTCDIRYYKGGQWACHHMWSLLDADQQIPWVDQPLVLHQKWRFYTQPYNASYHTPVHYGSDTDLVIGSPYEYDVPTCSKDVPGCELIDGNWIHTISGSKYGKHHFVSLNFHCHAPTCLSMEVYACSKNISLSNCNATTGTLLCKQKPVYGGTNAKELNNTKFNEPGYIAIPDCLWGNGFGLEKPINLTGVPLHMIKKCNGTYNGRAQGHYGEMAGGQPWVF